MGWRDGLDWLATVDGDRLRLWIAAIGSCIAAAVGLAGLWRSFAADRRAAGAAEPTFEVDVNRYPSRPPRDDAREVELQVLVRNRAKIGIVVEAVTAVSPRTLRLATAARESPARVERVQRAIMPANAAHVFVYAAWTEGRRPARTLRFDFVVRTKGRVETTKTYPIIVAAERP